jgi:hypothetical protein
MKTSVAGLVAAVLVGAAMVPVALRAQEKPAEGKGVVILDTSGFWRFHLTLRTPVVRDGETLKEIGAACNTPAPPADWTATEFDDSDWVRLAGAPFASWSHWEACARANVGFIYCQNGSLAVAQTCLRGKFQVDDPARAKGLKFTVKYRGGAAVFVNGKEIARGYLPKQGALTPETPAEVYPREAYFLEDGTLPEGYGRKGSNSERLQLRLRTLEVEIPTEALKKGTNVLAISLHRAPMPKEAYDKFKQMKTDSGLTYFLWDTCGLFSARLEEAEAGAVRANARRPAGVCAWNSSLLSTDTDVDWGDSNEPLKPIRIVGTRNGAFSGKVLVGSDSALVNLKASITGLAGPGGAVIPASSVAVRFAVPDLPRKAAEVNRFDSLLESPPAEVPVRTKKLDPGVLRILPGQPAPVAGAVVPVWVTVKVPADAKVGDYRGTLTVGASGKTVACPVDLRVSGFRLPDPKDYRTFVELIQSPDTLAAEYGTPLWSDAHWKLIEKSLSFTGQVGSKTCYVPLICETNMGNEQSMVRWVRQGENKYSYDFSVMEKYLDLVAKRQGPPTVVCFLVWDNFLEGGQFGDEVQRLEGEKVREERLGYKGKGPEVTVLEGGKARLPSGGQASRLQLPQYSEAEAKALWEPLAKELLERMRKRGMEKVMALGLATDATPTPTIVNLWKELLPGVPWTSEAHPYRDKIQGVPVVYTAAVWHPRFIAYDGTSKQGWKNPRLMVQFARDFTEYGRLTVERLIGEQNIGGEQRGFGRWGADFWPVVKSKRGDWAGRIFERYPKANWRNLNIKIAMLGPGPDGPVATARFEVLREGVEECEARIFIEQGLSDGKLPPELASRAKELIAERNRAIVMGLSPHSLEGFQPADAYWRIHDWHADGGSVGYYWYLTSGWQERSRKLYDLAAEVKALVGGK